MDFARVLGAGEVLLVGGALLYGDHLTTVSVSPEFDGAPHLFVVGGGWVSLDVDLEPLVVPGDAVSVLDLTCGPFCVVPLRLFTGAYERYWYVRCSALMCGNVSAMHPQGQTRGNLTLGTEIREFLPPADDVM